MAHQGFEGVLVPVITPFRDDLSPDADMFVAICKSLMAEGADGLAVFGTTSEANSMSSGERRALLERLIDEGIPAAKLMPGAGACSITEAAENAAHAAKLGCGGILLLPPFYYKGMSDDGLFDFYSAVIDRAASPSLRIYLYHIPPVAQVGISYDLIDRLLKAFPGTVVGLKDSSGEWDNTKGMLERFPGFEIFYGSEIMLLEVLRNGGRGCITATGNVNTAGIKAVHTNWRTDKADELQAQATKIRKIIQARPVIPAMKALVALETGDDRWATVRPPMRRFPEAEARKLRDELTQAGHKASALAGEKAA